MTKVKHLRATVPTIALARISKPISLLHARYRRAVATHPRIVTVCKFSLVFGMFWLICWQRLDPDFGWHLQAGNYIAAHGVPGHDIYSYTASQFRWINHEWGYDVLLAHLYNLPWGWAVLSTVFATLWTATLALADRKASAFVLFVSTLALAPYAGIRPTVVTLFFFILLLNLSHLKSARSKLAVPLIFLVWANLHGGLIIGLVALAYFAIRDHDIRWLWVLLTSVLATFINPYGPRDYVEIFRTVFDRTLHFQITEWNYFTVFMPARLYLVLWLCGFWIVAKDSVWSWLKRLRHHEKGEPIGDAFVGPFLLAFGMSATRNIPLFVVATVKELGRYIRHEKALIPKELNRWSVGLLTIFALGITWSAVVSLRLTYRPLTFVRGVNYPAQSVAYLKAHGCDGGNLFNSYDYGGYLIWKLPDHKIYIDGRMPSWRDEAGQKYMDHYFKVFKDRDYQKAQFANYNVRCALLQVGHDNTRLIDWLKKDGWRPAVTTDYEVLLLSPAR